MAFKDPKFDSFLKKTLSPKIYEQVKIREPCVVISRSENHTFRFVFATDQNICVTDNPAKSILFSISFSDIISIEQIHDAADFLQKELQDIVQHIRLKFKPPAGNQLNANNSTTSRLFSAAKGLVQTNSLVSSSSNMVENGVASTSTLSNHVFFDLIHIYVLNRTSVILPMLCSLRTSSLLELTAKMEVPRIAEETGDDAGDVITLSAVLADIRNNLALLLSRDADAETIYELLHQIKVLLATSMPAKSLFWRNSEMLLLCCNLLSKFSRSGNNSLLERADEIECAVLIIEILCVALEKTEALDSCHKILHQASKTLYTEVVSLVVEGPTLSPHLHQHDEIRSLCRDHTKAGCDLMCALLRVADQASWSALTDGALRPTLTSDLIMTIVKDHPQQLRYLERVSREAMTVWNGAECVLSPSQAVAVHRLFTVLARSIASCDAARSHVADTFSVEFKYYMRPSTLRDKIPGNYPAAAIVRDVITHVTSAVLDLTASQWKLAAASSKAIT